ncbi:uncharacterized protein LOC141600652 [Silene latifolia]|uniref:uncharacterized protein LOC141600652 n=1 Tax=Silene latifolia TaxID=37657 RepID=UPI003D77330A
MAINCSDHTQFPPLVSSNPTVCSGVDPSTNVASSSVVVGGPQSSEVQKTVNVNQLVGLAPYDLDAIAPEESSSWMVQGKRRKGKSPLVSIPEEPEDLLSFTAEDVKDELAYWKNSVYGFVLGANPPVEVVEGFLKRLWSKFPMDKVSFCPNGVFLVRFKSAAAKDQVLRQGHFLFDNKPLIVRPWSEEVELVKTDVKDVPVWIRIHSLPLKFWGKCLPKIAGLMGTYIRSDDATKEKTRLGFARVMIDVPFGKPIPETVKFLDEDGNIVSLKVEFEWKPIACTKCKGIGHSANSCRKEGVEKKKVSSQKVERKQWRPKQAKQPAGKQPVPVVRNGKYHMITTPARNIIRLSRQEIVEAGLSSMKFGSHSFMDSLNNVTPTVGIGTNGSALPPPGGLFGLLETKVKPLALNSVRNNLCANWCVSTNSQYHRGGRVWILWNPSMFAVNFLEYNAQFIHMEVVDLGTGRQFHLTMVYAFNELLERKLLWQKLCSFQKQIHGAWVICGDFNTVLVPSERLGGNSSIEEMEDFKNCVDECEVADCPASGSYYTWNNKQEVQARVYSRLDRVLVNHNWLNDNGSVYAHFYCEGIFDHTPCVIQSVIDGTKNRRHFKYYNMWSRSEDFQSCVKHVWDNSVYGTHMFRLVKKLKLLKSPLKQLNKTDFDDIENNTARARMHLEYVQEKLRSDPLNEVLIQQEKNSASAFRFLNQACHEYLVQKSKAVWLEQGDQNTKYFHSLIKVRQVKNKVMRIADMRGRQCETATQIQQAFLEFYEELLGTEADTRPISTQTVQMGRVCSGEHHSLLMAPVTNDEIKQVLFSIPNHKAAGPDGYSSAFFKDSWDVVGELFCKAIHDFFLNGKLLKQINHTLITLVPKIDLPQNVSQFRPISCCNVVYKCISKLMCNRLAKVLPFIISESQGGFIQGRSIVENILICQDIIRCYQRKAASPRFMLKVDLKKAYDSVSWAFLKQMMNALNFPDQFVAMVMECVETASYSLVLNGEVFGHFKGKKGLRQGDPLSPLLFTVAMEYLSRVLNYTTNNMPFKFHPLCSPMKLSHLMFADDLLLFCKGDISSIMVLMRSFATFSYASGLQMSQTKTSAYFNGVQNSVKADILQVSGFSEGLPPFRYLGVPITCGRMKKQDCNILVERLVERIRKFGTKKLSYAGRLTLVNSVLSTVYSYWANIFIIPKGVLNKLNAICRNYLWDGNAEYIRVPLVGWDKVCAPKDEGGLAVRDSLSWNWAIIGKLVWWVYNCPERLWVRWVHQVYLKGLPWFDYKPSGDISWGWKNICRVKELLLPGYVNGQWMVGSKQYTVGDGYEMLRQKFQSVQWAKYVWNSWSIPRHQFVGWLIARKALMLKERLFALGISSDDLCVLCGRETETFEHVFQKCQYSSRLLDLLAQLGDFSLPQSDLILWVGQLQCTQLRKGLLLCLVQSVYYQIWMQRNKARIDGCLVRPENCSVCSGLTEDPSCEKDNFISAIKPVEMPNIASHSEPTAASIPKGFKLVNEDGTTFDIRPSYINLGERNMYRGMVGEDPRKHMEVFTNYCSTIPAIKGVTQDKIKEKNSDDDKGWEIIEENATHCAEYGNPRRGIRTVNVVDSAVVTQLEAMNACFDKLEL